MRKIIPLILLLTIGTSMAQESVTATSSTTVESSSSISNCNVSPAFINSIKESLLTELNLDYSFVNITSQSCYQHNGNPSIYLNLMLKNNESSIEAKSVSASFYVNDDFDYSVVFSVQEDNTLGYSLKRKHISYLINGTNDEYYVSLSPAGTCNDFKTYFDSLSGEKYFNEQYDSCQIVLKTSDAELKDWVNNNVNYAYYFSDKIRYSFSGYSEGDYNLESIANSINCDLSSNDYYYPEFKTDCYGIYQDKGRIYVSKSYELNNNAWINIYIHAIKNGKAKISAYAYSYDEEELDLSSVQSIVNNLINEFIPGQTLTLDNNDYSISGSKIINSFEFNDESLNGLKSRREFMNMIYYDNYTHVTISEPYIQVYVPENETSSQEILPRPYYWGRNFIITSNRVYSSVNLDENNEVTAVEVIKGYVNNYVETNDWLLNMSVTGPNVYYPVLYESSRSYTNGGLAIQDSLTANYDGFAELEKEDKSIWESIVDFFKSLLGF